MPRFGTSRIQPFILRLAAIAFAATGGHRIAESQVNTPAQGTPRVELIAASLLALPGAADSNSPAIWQLVAGRAIFHVITSFAGQPSRAEGPRLGALSIATPIRMQPRPAGGVWMEAVVADDGATWYGFYHLEQLAETCPGVGKMLPRIGAARSTDRGSTWEDLGIILEAPPGTHRCDTTNKYFVGGVGDFTVMLDADSRDLYFFYSQYVTSVRWQGIGIARMAWADRDEPVGKVTVRRGRMWLPGKATAASDESDASTWTYPAATPLFPPSESWHDGDALVDAFWGPSVHWNTYLQQYVMLLNRTRDADWTQDGIYVSFAPRLDDARLWSQPVKILDGGRWYPQVLGTEAGLGTDKIAGEQARFFISGASRHVIRFLR